MSSRIDCPLTVQPYNRARTRARGFPPLRLEVTSFSHDLYGPLETTISAAGDILLQRELFSWLSAPLELYADLPDAVWWGHIAKVRVRQNGTMYEADLGKIYNKLATAYSATTPGTAASARATATWAHDLLSQTYYGIRERLLEQVDTTPAAAAAFRDSLLAADQSVAWPWVNPTPDPGPDAAELVGRGDWDRFFTRYYGRLAAGEGLDKAPATVADKTRFGDATARNGVAESFTLSAGEPFYLANCALYIQKVSPAGGAWPAGNNAVIGIYPDDGTGLAPDLTAPIELATLLASDITAQLDQHVVPFANTTLLAPATPYWGVIGHTGPDDANHYYFVGTPEAAGYAGLLRIYDVGTGTWSARVPDADLAFLVGGTKATTTQMADLVTAVAPFLVGTRIATASGINTNTHRNGDSLAGDVLQELLDMGTSTGARLRAYVDRYRYLVVGARPAYSRDTVPVLVGPGGVAYDRRNELLGPELSPAGLWCGFQGGDPLALEANALVRTGRFFVASATYTVGQGWRVERESSLDVFSTAGG